MWYERENTFVRAPAPSSFDDLVKRLEDDDSVIFKSISLPCGRKPPDRDPHGRGDPPIKSIDLSFLDFSGLNLASSPVDRRSDDGYFADEFEYGSSSADIGESDMALLKYELAKLNLEGVQKSEILTQKDRQIAKLKGELRDIEAAKSPRRARGIITSLGSAEFYKGKYELALLELESLKKSLEREGKLRRVSAKSARPIKPSFSGSYRR
jgi:hypothetical protein